MIELPNRLEKILLAELQLGLPPVFYFEILEIKDEWAFVLKLHALFEGALTKLIRKKLNLRKTRVVNFTPHDSFYSRVQLAERINLIDSEYKKYLLCLNHHRNQLTHNIQFINLKLSHYFDSLHEDDFRRTSRDLGLCFQNLPLTNQACRNLVSNSLMTKVLKIRNPKHKPKTIRELFMCLSAKFTIWNSGIYVLEWLSLHFHHEIVDGKIQQDEDLMAKLQDLLLDPKVKAFAKKLDEENWP